LSTTWFRRLLDRVLTKWFGFTLVATFASCTCRRQPAWTSATGLLIDYEEDREPKPASIEVDARRPLANAGAQ
jgi:hypothetical protein